MNEPTSLEHDIEHFIKMITPVFPVLVADEQQNNVYLSDAICKATHTIVQIVKHVALQPHVFQDPFGATPSEPEAKIQYHAELLAEELRLLISEGALVYRDHIIETSSWEEFAITAMLPCVVSSIDQNVTDIFSNGDIGEKKAE